MGMDCVHALDPSIFHDCYPVAHVPDDLHVMGDEEHRQAELLFQIHDQPQNLGLHRDVQCCCGLIGHNELRIYSQDSGEHHPLILPTAELMGITIDMLIIQPNDIHKLQDALVHLSLIHLSCQAKPEGLSNALAYAHSGIQGGLWVLKDHLHLWPQLSHCRSAKLRNVSSIKADFARCGLYQPEEEPSKGGLAAAALSNQPQGCPLVDME